MVPGRSLGSTLVSAGATFALLAAISSGTSKFLPASANFDQILIFHAIRCLGAPHGGLFLSIRAAFRVWRVRRALKLQAEATSKRKGFQVPQLCNSIAIMAICPLYLHVPESTPREQLESLRNLLENTNGKNSQPPLCNLVQKTQPPPDSSSYEQIRKIWCPLEVTCTSWPALKEIKAADTAQGPLQEDQRIARLFQLPAATQVGCRVAANGEIQAADAAQGNISGFSALQAVHDGNASIKPDGGTAAAAAPTDKVLAECIEVRDLEHRVAVMLVSGMVPEYTQLRYVRLRNRFQAVVTTLQVGGYMVNLGERMMQHLDISAMEAIVAFLCLLSALHLLIELYACSNYQRPLLLRVSPEQISHLREAIEQKDHGYIEAREILLICACLLVFLMSLPLIYFVYHYWQESFMSALAVLIFLLASIANSVFLIRNKLLKSSGKLCWWDIPVSIPRIPGHVPLSEVCSGVMCGCGMALAIVATVVDWQTFREAPVDWIAWIWPHASTS